MGYADDKTNAELLALEKRIKKEYKKAYEEMAETAEAYFDKFEERYQKEYEAFQEGKYTKAQFDAWVETQIARGKAWEAKRDQLANIITNANQVASELINGTTPSVYALNANYTAWEVSQVYPASDFATSFDLVSADTVSNLLQDKGNYTDFKTVRVNPKRDYSWNTKQIQSALTSGILQGKSIDKLADSFMVVQKRNRNAAVRNARTAVTSAQNSGRISSMKRAQDMGIEVKKKWLSASDNRVRDSHAHLNGQIRDIDDTFDNDLLYPGDSNGIPAEVYNCRCTLTYIYPKYQNVESNEEYSEDKNKGESYQQWVKRKKGEQSIKVSSSVISSPRSRLKGKPTAVVAGASLNNRQKKIDALLPAEDTYAIVRKKSVSMRDLAALSASNGVEYAMLTRKGERMILRGNLDKVNLINGASARKYAKDGWKWSGHTHVVGGLVPSAGDMYILSQFKQKKSLLYNYNGDYTIIRGK